jgi:hypothetical protein
MEGGSSPPDGEEVEPMKRFPILVASLAVLTTAPLLRADVWDEGPDADNTCGATSDNDLIHGVSQVHDLGALTGPSIDQDFYTLASRPYSSYEVVLDGLTGDLNNGGNPDFEFERLDTSCAPVQTFVAAGGWGFSRAIRWQSGGTGALGLIRVGDAACGTTCTAADQYHLRFYDTTYAVPRFNNSATQTTILIVQNPTHYAVDATAWFFDNAGVLLGSASLTLPPHATNVLNTSTIAPVAGQAGSIMISNNARYGDLAGKAVALEPGTGFTFDTAMTPRAN